MACYKKSYKHTLKARTELKQVNKKLSNNEDILFDFYNLKNEISILNKTIGGQTSNPELVQEKLLDFISNDHFNVDVVSIEDVHLFKDNEFLIYTNSIELQGSYQDLTNTLYGIEKSFKSSRVVSTHMFSKKKYGLNRKKLFLKIILQNYENTK